MKSIILLFSILLPILATATSRVGTLGRSNGELLSYPSSDSGITNDTVKFLAQQNGLVTFQYKGFDEATVKTHTVDLSDLAPTYIDALNTSAVALKWVAVRATEDIKQCRETCLADSTPGWELKACLAGCER